MGDVVGKNEGTPSPLEALQQHAEAVEALLPPMTLDGEPVTGLDRAKLPFLPGKNAWTSAEVAAFEASLEVQWAEDDRLYEELVASGAATPRMHEESPFPNPYWDEVKRVPGDDLSMRYERVWEPSTFGGFSQMRKGRVQAHRDDLTRKYAWAITAPESVQFVAEHAGSHGLVEIGAGNGYWAWCLRHLGVDTVPYDKQPPASGANFYHSPIVAIRDDQGRRVGRRPTTVATPEWVPVRRGRPWHASRWPHRTLFLCWPPYKDLMAASALRHYRGDRVIYIGEGEGGCTASKRFFDRLEAEWTLVAEHKPVQWSGIHDWVSVYERAAEPRPWPGKSEYDSEYDEED